MKAKLLTNGYIEIESENEDERYVLDVMADEGIDLAEISRGGRKTALRFRRSFDATLQANAAEDFRDSMLGQVYAMKDELQKLQTQLEGLWGHEADLTEDDKFGARKRLEEEQP